MLSQSRTSNNFTTLLIFQKSERPVNNFTALLTFQKAERQNLTSLLTLSITLPLCWPFQSLYHFADPFSHFTTLLTLSITLSLCWPFQKAERTITLPLSWPFRKQRDKIFTTLLTLSITLPLCWTFQSLYNFAEPFSHFTTLLTLSITLPLCWPFQSLYHFADLSEIRADNLFTTLLTFQKADPTLYLPLCWPSRKQIGHYIYHFADLPESRSDTIFTSLLTFQKAGRTIYHFAFGQSPFPVMEHAVEALKQHAGENAYLDVQGQYKVTLQGQRAVNYRFGLLENRWQRMPVQVWVDVVA